MVVVSGIWANANTRNLAVSGVSNDLVDILIHREGGRVGARGCYL